MKTQSGYVVMNARRVDSWRGLSRGYCAACSLPLRKMRSVVGVSLVHIECVAVCVERRSLSVAFLGQKLWLYGRMW